MAENVQKCLAVVRIRGNIGISHGLKETFKMIHLTRRNHVTIIDNRSSNMGMLQKVKDYSTWGEVSLKTISSLLRKRGRVIGDKKITDQFVREKVGLESIEDLSKAIMDLKINFTKIPEVRPMFRLHSPRKGFRKKIRRPYPNGELGYRGETINRLIMSMV